MGPKKKKKKNRRSQYGGFCTETRPVLLSCWCAHIYVAFARIQRMPCWHCHHCRSVRATGPSSRWKRLWLCSSSLTQADHILTRSPSGEIESDKSQNRVRNVAESFPPACLLWQLVSHSTLASSTGKKLGCDTMAGSDDLAFLPVFGLHRNNSTLLSSDLWHFKH